MGWSIQLPWMYLNIWRGYEKRGWRKGGAKFGDNTQMAQSFFPRESNADENKFLFHNNSPVPRSEWDGVVREYKKRRANFLRAHISPKLLRPHRQCAHIYKHLLFFVPCIQYKDKRCRADDNQRKWDPSFWKKFSLWAYAYPQPEVNSNCIEKKTGHGGIGRR